MIAALAQHLISIRDGDLLFRILRDVRGRLVKPTSDTYEKIIGFVLEQSDYPLEDVCKKGQGGSVLIS